MPTAEEIVVKLTAQNAELKAGMAEASAAVQTSTDSMAASFKSATASFAAFDEIQKSNLATAAQVAAAQQTINDVQATGAFTAEELAAKQALVDAAMLKVGKETQAASGALSMFTRNSRTMYSTSALITDAMTGQFSRMRREVAALANETGVMASAFRLIASPIGVAVLALAGFGVAMVEAADRYERFEQTILSTGNIIGMTAGQLQTMADDVGNLTGASFDAVEAVNKIGQSGLFTGEQLRTASEAAVYFSQVTGENMNKAASVIEQLQDKPKEAIVKLNDQYHFLTETQAELIVKLLNTGQSAQAAAVAVQAFHDAMADRAQQMLDNTTALARDWQAVKEWTEQSTEAVAEYLNMLGGSKDITDQLNRAYIQLANDQSGLFKLAHPFSSQADAIKQDMAAIDALRDKEAQQEAQAKKTAEAGKQAAQTLDGGVHKGHSGSGMSALEQQFQEQEAAAHASYDQMKQDAADFWNAQANNAKNSAQVQAQAYQKYITVRHELDAEGLAADNEATRKREENARKAAEAAKRAEEGRVRAVREADREIYQEVQQEAARRLQLAVAEADHLRQVELGKAQSQVDDAQANGDNPQQLAAVELNAVNERLAAEETYYRTLEGLYSDDAVKFEQYQTKLKQAQTAADKERAAIAREEQQKVQQSVNGMIQGTTTAQQAIRNIGNSIVAEFVADEAKKLETYLAHQMAQVAVANTTEQAKTAATVAGNAERVAADTAGQAQSLLVQGEAAVKWIITEAAKAAAGAFNALVSIPYVGPFLAVGASIAAFATVSKLVGSVASAEGGWERVPADGVQTMLHKDEMVLPKHVADPVRNMARGGRRDAGGGTINIHALDSRSFLSALKRNPRAMQMALAHAGRNGW